MTFRTSIKTYHLVVSHCNSFRWPWSFNQTNVSLCLSLLLYCKSDKQGYSICCLFILTWCNATRRRRLIFFSRKDWLQDVCFCRKPQTFFGLWKTSRQYVVRMWMCLLTILRNSIVKTTKFQIYYPNNSFNFVMFLYFFLKKNKG